MEKMADALGRSAIGHKTQLEELESLVKHANDKFPRFNLLKHNDGDVRIELALAGYQVEDIKVESFPDRIIISSEGREEDFKPIESEYICAHRGIAARSFRKTFPVAGQYEIRSVTFRNGILRIDVDRRFKEADPVVHSIE